MLGLARRRLGASVVAPPLPETYDFRVGAIATLSYYKLDSATITDQQGVQAGGVATGTLQTGQPTIADLDADGTCLGFIPTTRLAIGYNAAHKTASGGVSIIAQLRDTGAKQVIAASDAQNSAGGWSLEVQADGAVRAFLRDAGNTPQILLGSAGAVELDGTAHHFALTWGAAGLTLYLDGSEIDSDGAVTDGADNNAASEISIGAWHTGTTPVLGLLGRLVLFNGQPSAAQVLSLAAPLDATFANPDTAIDAEADGDPVVLDALANDHYQGSKAGATVAITVQGTLGTWAGDGSNDLTYTPGATDGTDTAGRYTVNGSAAAALTVVVVPAPGGPDDDPWGRDAFWTSDGYTRVFYKTPLSGDIGGNIETWFKTQWNNGQAVPQYSAAQGSVVTSIAAAPDGSPSIRTVLPAGTSDQGVFVRGQHLGPTGNGLHAVFAVEVWTEGYAPNGQLGCYQGVGHHWGSVDNVTHAPGGSTNFGDAWSIRNVKSISDNWSIYVYEEENTSSGQTYQSTVKGANGAWQLIECEVLLNDPHTSSNGRLRLYRNETLIREVLNHKMRNNAASRPKGLGYFVQHNLGADQQETFYHRNFKIYTKSAAGPIEAVDGTAQQIAIAVDSAARQTWHGAGWGCGSTSHATNMSSVISSHATQLFTELNTKVLRVHNPQDADFLTAYKPITDLATPLGVDTILATGYVAAGSSTPTALANAIDAAITAGVPITHCSLQNEPDGNANNDVSTSNYVSWHNELRARLDTLGRTSVKIIALEWAHFPTGSGSDGSVEFDLLDAAGIAGPSQAVIAGAGHCYRDCPTNVGYDSRWLTVGSPLWSCETGSAGSPNAQARFCAGLNHGVSVEIFHIGQSKTSSDGDLSQKLVQFSGARQPYQPAYGVISRALERGAVFRLCHSDDRPSGLPVTTADRMIRDGGSQYNPRIQVAACKRTNNKWAIVAVNATQGSSDNPTSFLNGSYKSAKLQMTCTFAELSGAAKVFSVERASSSGAVTSPGTKNMQNGIVRFTLAAGETIALIEN